MPRLSDDDIHSALADGLTGWTHDEGGVTELDVELARAIEAVAQPPEA